MKWYLLQPWWLKVVIGLPIYAFTATMLYLPFERFWKWAKIEEPDMGGLFSSVFWPITLVIGIPVLLCIVGPVALGVKINHRIDQRKVEKVERAKAQAESGKSKHLAMVMEALQLNKPEDPGVIVNMGARSFKNMPQTNAQDEIEELIRKVNEMDELEKR